MVRQIHELGRAVMTCGRPKYRPWTYDLVPFLDRSRERLLDGDAVSDAMDELSDGLWWIRLAAQENWQAMIPAALSHPICALLHEDPFTGHSFSKPRGYAGDATLLDLIYYDQSPSDVLPVSQLGRQILWRNRDAPAPRAVRERRNHLAQLIDEAAMKVERPAILSIAAGHLREGLLSVAVASGQIGRFVALDQDAESLAEIRKRFLGRVETVRQPIRHLIAGSFQGQYFDFVYAAGLYDYLNERFASRLTAILFSLLRPGGQLVIANFCPDILDVGYMQSQCGT